MRAAFIALAFIGLNLGACNSAPKDKAVKKKEYKYYCIMNPEIGADKPGVCSKCGMQLVEREDK